MSKTTRIYLHTTDSIDNQNVEKKNHADCTFDLGNANIVKNKGTNMTIALVRASIPTGLSLFRVDNTNPDQWLNETENTSKYDFEVIVSETTANQFTANRIIFKWVKHSSTPYLYKLDLANKLYRCVFNVTYGINEKQLVAGIQRILLDVGASSTPPVSLTLQYDGHSNTLKFVPSTPFTHDLYFSNMIDIKGTSSFYNGGDKPLRIFGCPTETNQNYTTFAGTPALTAGANKSYIDITFESLEMYLRVDNMGDFQFGTQNPNDYLEECSGRYMLCDELETMWDTTYNTIVVPSGSNANVATLAKYENGYTYYLMYGAGAVGGNWFIFKVGALGKEFYPSIQLIPDYALPPNFSKHCAWGMITNITTTLGTTLPLMDGSGSRTFGVFASATDGSVTALSLTPKQRGTNVYDMNITYDPILLQSNVGMDTSYSSAGKLTNILASIECDSSILNKSIGTTITISGENGQEPQEEVLTTAPQIVNLDGANDHIEIDLTPANDTRMLSWKESWSIGFHLPEHHNPNTGRKETLFKRGDNGMYWIKNSGNNAFYMTAMDGVYDPPSYPLLPHSHGANTWTAVPDDSKHLITYDATTGKLRWYMDNVLKGTITATGTLNVDGERNKGVLATDPFLVGDAMAGNYGGGHWDTHLDNLIMMDTNLVHGSQQITDYFTDDNFDTHEYSNHIIHEFNFDTHTTDGDTITDSINPDIIATIVNGNGNNLIITGEEQQIITSQNVSEEQQQALGFTLSGTDDPIFSGDYLYRGNIIRVRHTFQESTSTPPYGIFQKNHTENGESYTLTIYKQEGVSGWKIGYYGEGQGGQLPNDHEFLSNPYHTGSSIGGFRIGDKDVNGILYPDAITPPWNINNGTMTLNTAQPQAETAENENGGNGEPNAETLLLLSNTETAEGYISYENKNLAGSHKKIGTEILSDLRLKLLDSGGEAKSCINKSIFYELEIKYDETF